MKTQKVVFEQGNKQVIQEGNIFFNRIFENGETFESQDFNTLEKAKLDLGIAPTTQESNKLIAEFMSIAIIDSNGNHKEEYKYHSDWNWLMEVVEKIFKDFYNLNPCPIGLKMKIEGHLVKANKDEVYNACVEFIKWYNNQTN
jgi:hypothetical protein